MDGLLPYLLLDKLRNTRLTCLKLAISVVKLEQFIAVSPHVRASDRTSYRKAYCACKTNISDVVTVSYEYIRAIQGCSLYSKWGPRIFKEHSISRSLW